jgi:hypothetical protein
MAAIWAALGAGPLHIDILHVHANFQVRLPFLVSSIKDKKKSCERTFLALHFVLLY